MPKRDRRNHAESSNLQTIAIFVPGLRPGDAFTNIAIDLATGFLNEGIETVYLIFRKGEGPSEPPPNGSTLIELPSKRASHSFIQLARTLRRIRPDALISMPLMMNLPAVLGWLLTGRIGVLAIVEQAILSYEVGVEHRGELRFKLSPILARALYARASGVVAVSEGVLRDLTERVGIKLQQSRTEIIPNPVAGDRIVAKSRENPGHPWLIPATVPTFVYVGRLARQKNIPLLLHAARFLTTEGKLDFRIAIVGAGPLLPALQAQAAELSITEFVDFVGHRDNPYPFMSRATGLILPSEEEGFGLVVVEALACGVPVIATDCAGPRAVITEGTGYLVPNHDAKAIASAMTRLMLNQSDISAEKCRSRANDFSPDIVARKWLDWLCRLAPDS